MLRQCDGYSKVFVAYGLRVDLALQNGNVGQISVLFIVVKTVTDNKLVLDHGSAVIGREGNLTARGLVEKSAGLNAVGVSVFEELRQAGERSSAVHDVLDNKKIVLLEIFSCKIKMELDLSGVLRARAV